MIKLKRYRLEAKDNTENVTLYVTSIVLRLITPYTDQ